ncbi:unnamed protein product [Discosporangium mesarthrocarpum]
MLDVGRQGMEGRSRGSRAMGSSSRGWGFPVMLLRWFCTVAVVVLTRPRTAAGVTVDVEMGKEECFIVTAKKGELINGNYEVITPGRMENIKVTLKRGEGGNGNVLYQAKGKVEDFFSKEALDAGDYNLCFHNSEDDDMISNGSTSQGNKLVGLQLRLANAKTGTQIKEEEMEGPILDKEGEDDGNGGSMYSMIYGNQEGKRTIGELSTVLLFYCFTVLLGYRFTVLPFYCSTVLLFCCFTTLLFYHLTVLPFYCFYCFTFLLFYYFTVLLFYHFTVLPSYRFTVSQCFLLLAVVWGSSKVRHYFSGATLLHHGQKKVDSTYSAVDSRGH